MEPKKPQQSLTIVSSVVTILVTLGVTAGVISQNEAEQLTTLLLQITPLLTILLGQVGVIIGRMRASTKISLSPSK